MHRFSCLATVDILIRSSVGRECLAIRSTIDCFWQIVSGSRGFTVRIIGCDRWNSNHELFICLSFWELGYAVALDAIAYNKFVVIWVHSVPQVLRQNAFWNVYGCLVRLYSKHTYCLMELCLKDILSGIVTLFLWFDLRTDSLVNRNIVCVYERRFCLVR